MSTSIFGYPVSFGTATYGASTDPVGTAVMRDGIANGLLHYADEYAQVRVCAHFPGTALTFADATSSTVDSSPTANQWYLLAGGILGEWPLTQRMSGAGYALRVGIRGKTSNAAGTVTFRLVLCPAGRLYEYIDRAVDYVWESTATASTVIAWRSGATLGAGAYSNKLVVDAATAQSWVRSAASPDDATTPRTVQQCLVALHLIAKTTNNTGVPTMYGAYAHEFVGA